VFNRVNIFQQHPRRRTTKRKRAAKQRPMGRSPKAKKMRRIQRQRMARGTGRLESQNIHQWYE
jgi:hypothetical protein